MRKARKDKKQAGLATKLTKKIKLVKLKNVDYDPTIFQSMATSPAVDNFFSNKIGVPRACNFICIGDPGVGKSTVMLDILADAAAKKAKVLFISAEMNHIDMYEYMERFPKFGGIDILFLADYDEENPKLLIEEVLKKGYDMVLGDSFVEIQSAVKEGCFMTTGASEKWLIDLMVKHNGGDNDSNAYTTFLMIQQVTKGGNFVGSNKLKHNTTGMLEMRFVGEDDPTGERYLVFTKNRRGGVLKRLFFDLSDGTNVTYNSEKFKQEEDNRKAMAAELKQLAQEAEDFDGLFTADASEVGAPSEDGEEATEMEVHSEVVDA